MFRRIHEAFEPIYDKTASTKPNEEVLEKEMKKIMTIEKMFPNVSFEFIENEYDNPYTFANFYVPRGYWYSTDSDTTAKYAEEDLSIYVFGGFLKMVNPDSDPLKGTWYYWV